MTLRERILQAMSGAEEAGQTGLRGLAALAQKGEPEYRERMQLNQRSAMRGDRGRIMNRFDYPDAATYDLAVRLSRETNDAYRRGQGMPAGGIDFRQGPPPSPEGWRVFNPASPKADLFASLQAKQHSGPLGPPVDPYVGRGPPRIDHPWWQGPMGPDPDAAAIGGGQMQAPPRRRHPFIEADN